MTLNERLLEAAGRHWPVTRAARWVVLSLSEEALRAQLLQARDVLAEVLECSATPLPPSATAVV
jgi:hypothetical protein